MLAELIGRWETARQSAMIDPEEHSTSEPDDKLDGLVRAIAAELLQLGYRPAQRPGDVLSETLGARTINAAIWHAMKAIQAGDRA